MSPELSQQIDSMVQSGNVTQAAAQTAKARLEKIADDPTLFAAINGGIRCEWARNGRLRILEVHADGQRVYEDDRDVDD